MARTKSAFWSENAKKKLKKPKYCKEAQDYFNALPFVLSEKEAEIKNDCIKSLVDSGLFDKLDGLWFADGDSKTRAINAKNPKQP